MIPSETSGEYLRERRKDRVCCFGVSVVVFFFFGAEVSFGVVVVVVKNLWKDASSSLPPMPPVKPADNLIACGIDEIVDFDDGRFMAAASRDDLSVVVVVVGNNNIDDVESSR